MTTPAQQAIRIAGSQMALARAVGVSQAAVSKWALGGRVSAENALGIERATSGQVSAADLRPDIFGGRNRAYGGEAA
jgi:DNA-binding transcriptional regulator YdaS (Cro superfamily)